MTAVLVQQVLKPRKLVSFQRMIKSVASRFGTQAAVNWTKAVLGHQAKINERALATAVASGKVERIAAVVKPLQLQQAIAGSIQGPLTKATQTAGFSSTAILRSQGLQASFNMVHPNVVLFARKQSAQLVVGVPAETRAVIAEVIAMGAERGLTIVEQARAIRETVGLAPNVARAPAALAAEIRAGQAGAATSRRMSAKLKQQIRSRIANGTVDDAFIRQATAEYATSLINRRALTIAHTESLRSSHHGLTESWKQAQDQGILPDTMRRFWIVTPDSRLSEEHAQIPGMNPEGRAIDEMFLTPEGEVMYPPSRPNCRCSVGVVINPRGGRVVEPEPVGVQPTVPTQPAPAPEMALPPDQFQDILRDLQDTPLPPDEAAIAGLPPRLEPDLSPAGRDPLAEAFDGEVLNGRPSPYTGGDSPLERHLDQTFAAYDSRTDALLTEGQYNAVVSYQNGSYSRINEQLRTGADYGLENLVERMDGAMANAPEMGANGIFWRGGQLPGGIGVGDSFVDKGYVSLSSFKSTAETFYTDADSRRGPNAMLRIGVEPPQRGLWMSAVIGDGTEGEFILPRGTTFQVVGQRDMTREEYRSAFGPHRGDLFSKSETVRVYDILARG